jgi:hypothetical protein
MVLGNDPADINSTDELAALRAAKAKQQGAQNALASLPPAADAAKTLSETDVGGGQSALQQILGGTSGKH